MMNKADQSWLENRVSAAVDDDFYLDRDEEKRIKEEGTARGILIKDIDLIIKSALDEVGAISTGVNLSTVTQTNLTDVEKAEIDDLLKRTAVFIEQGQYTDPPEKSAKANLDAIHKIDSVGQYQADKVKNLEEIVVEHYLALAEKSYRKGDIQSVTKWLGRAKLFSRSTESIIDAERKYGLLPREN